MILSNHITNFAFFSLNNIGSALSGGDRIFLELARNWSKNTSITIYGSQETGLLVKRYRLPSTIKFIQIDSQDNSPVVIHQIRRFVRFIIYFLSHLSEFKNYTHLYSVSDFYPDLLPALLTKLVNPKSVWIAGFFLFAPNPFSRLSPYNQTGRYLAGLIYYFGQKPAYWLVRLFSDIVFVTSSPDTARFRQRTVIIRGGVSLPKNLSIYQNLPKVYEAVFIGRFHPQKGVLLLPQIWQKVVARYPAAKLAVIGIGSLQSQLVEKIHQLKLENNIRLLGFQDGSKKYKTFSQSKIVLHPATYDSGGMAAAEAMAFGLPGVSFDLESLKTYYPQGMLKTPCFDLDRFSANIIRLLSSSKLYSQYSAKASQLIYNHWMWPNQSAHIYNTVINENTSGQSA